MLKLFSHMYQINLQQVENCRFILRTDLTTWHHGLIWFYTCIQMFYIVNVYKLNINYYPKTWYPFIYIYR